MQRKAMMITQISTGGHSRWLAEHYTEIAASAGDLDAAHTAIARLADGQCRDTVSYAEAARRSRAQEWEHHWRCITPGDIFWQLREEEVADDSASRERRTDWRLLTARLAREAARRGCPCLATRLTTLATRQQCAEMMGIDSRTFQRRQHEEAEKMRQEYIKLKTLCI